jgi:hypothetical protein
MESRCATLKADAGKKALEPQPSQYILINGVWMPTGLVVAGSQRMLPYQR